MYHASCAIHSPPGPSPPLWGLGLRPVGFCVQGCSGGGERASGGGAPTHPAGCCLVVINELRISPGPAASTLILISLPPLGNGRPVPPSTSSVLLFVTSKPRRLCDLSGGWRSSRTSTSPTGPGWRRGRMGGELGGLPTAWSPRGAPGKALTGSQAAVQP